MTDAGITRLGSLIAAIACVVVMVACAPSTDQPQVGRSLPGAVATSVENGEVGTANNRIGGCWGIDESLYRSGDNRDPVEIPCPELVDGDFLPALQRALAARGYHEGPVTGELDMSTRRAIRNFQGARGFDSDVLTIASARLLGLVAYAPDDL